MKKAASALMLSATLLTAPAATAQGLGTDWNALPEKLTDLLNSGWTISSHNNYETEIFNNNGLVFSFVVTKSVQYVVCNPDNPYTSNTNPMKGAVSSSNCRALN